MQLTKDDYEPVYLHLHIHVSCVLLLVLIFIKTEGLTYFAIIFFNSGKYSRNGTDHYPIGLTKKGPIK